VSTSAGPRCRPTVPTASQSRAEGTLEGRTDGRKEGRKERRKEGRKEGRITYGGIFITAETGGGKGGAHTQHMPAHANDSRRDPMEEVTVSSQ
jgi:hypothetical protein